MSSFKDYMTKEKNNDIINDGHFHVEKMGGRTGPPIRVKTDDGRTTHIHNQSDGKDTVEAKDVGGFVNRDDIEDNVTSLPKSPNHTHMQTDGQHTSPAIYPEVEEDQKGISIGGISEKIEQVLEGKGKFDKKNLKGKNTKIIDPHNKDKIWYFDDIQDNKIRVTQVVLGSITGQSVMSLKDVNELLKGLGKQSFGTLGFREN
jgi:hypothetical protein